MGLQKFLEHSRETIKLFGVRRYLFDLFYRVSHRVFGFMILNVVVLTAESLNAESLENPHGYELQFVSAEPLYKLASRDREALTGEFVDRALALGDRCFAVLDQGQVASLGWYSKRPTDIDNKISFNFNPSYVYMYKGYTAPSYRGQKLHALGMAQALLAYSKEGAKGLVSYVEANNYRSISSCERLGYETIGRIYLVQLFGEVFSFGTSGCAQAGVHLARKFKVSDQERFQLINRERLT